MSLLKKMILHKGQTFYKEDDRTLKKGLNEHKNVNVIIKGKMKGDWKIEHWSIYKICYDYMDQ